MATLLQCVNAVIREVGIAGGSELTTFDSADAEINRIIELCIDADVDVQKAQMDWPWMQAIAIVTLPAGDSVLPLPTALVEVVTAGEIATVSLSIPHVKIVAGSMVFAPETALASPVPQLEWCNFEAWFCRRPKSTLVANEVPSAWAIRPDRLVEMSKKGPTGGATIQYRYFMAPRRIPRHIDAVPRTPALIISPLDQQFVSVPRALVERAKMLWATAESRFDVLQIASATYATELEQMRFTYGTDQSAHGMISGDPMVMVVS